MLKAHRSAIFFIFFSLFINNHSIQSADIATATFLGKTAAVAKGIISKKIIAGILTQPVVGGSLATFGPPAVGFVAMYVGANYVFDRMANSVSQQATQESLPTKIPATSSLPAQKPYAQDLLHNKGQSSSDTRLARLTVHSSKKEAENSVLTKQDTEPALTPLTAISETLEDLLASDATELLISPRSDGMYSLLVYPTTDSAESVIAFPRAVIPNSENAGFPIAANNDGLHYLPGSNTDFTPKRLPGVNDYVRHDLPGKNALPGKSSQQVLLSPALITPVIASTTSFGFPVVVPAVVVTGTAWGIWKLIAKVRHKNQIDSNTTVNNQTETAHTITEQQLLEYGFVGLDTETARTMPLSVFADVVGQSIDPNAIQKIVIGCGSSPEPLTKPVTGCGSVEPVVTPVIGCGDTAPKVDPIIGCGNTEPIVDPVVGCGDGGVGKELPIINYIKHDLPPAKGEKVPDGWAKLKNGQGWRDPKGRIWKKDMKHRVNESEHWDISDRNGNKILEVDYEGNEIWPDGPKNKNKKP
ncbi:MAG TPA: hypothetical protein VFF04_04325 [Candidatus Babeliales bacterium]|nr:hypothetical protein [Candidatus Babeliales bacterium]